MKFNRYKYYNYTDSNGKQVVVAVSKHAGQTVKGYAVCAPTDTFDLEVGKKLAAARCNQKVLTKKYKSTLDKIAEVHQVICDLEDYCSTLTTRFREVENELADADKEVNSLLAELG